MSTQYTEPTTTAKILDTKTLWARREFLWEKYNTLCDSGSLEQWEEFLGCSMDTESYNDFCNQGHPIEWNAGNEHEGGELYDLNYLHDSIGSWAENTTMVLESHFVEYAEEWARSIQEVPSMLDSFINWDFFANSLRQEWSTVDFMGEEYLVQNC